MKKPGTARFPVRGYALLDFQFLPERSDMESLKELGTAQHSARGHALVGFQFLPERSVAI